MNSFQELVHEAQSELSRRRDIDDALIIAEYQTATRNALLERIVMFGGTHEFQKLATELAEAINVTIETATAMLWAVSNAIYQAAVTAKMPEQNITARVQEGAVADNGYGFHRQEASHE